MLKTLVRKTLLKVAAALEAADLDGKTAGPVIPEGFIMIDRPSGLPESPWKYFLKTPGAELIPTSKLQTIRARPKGIANALKYMWLSYNGLSPRRKPIDLTANPDGTYTVLDGNSTTAVARQAGWKYIVGIVND